MNTDSTWQIKSTGSGQTEQLGYAIGALLKGGEVIELKSDLGGGKTTFTRGLAAGAGSTDDVASPTFTISRVYLTPKFAIHHFDFYRLNEPGIVAHELQEIIDEPTVVIVIEWGDIVADVLPTDHITIDIAQLGDDERQIAIIVPARFAYLTEALPA